MAVVLPWSGRTTCAALSCASATSLAGVNIGLIDTVARYALDRDFHVIIDGILHAARYGHMLEALYRDHQGVSCFFYLDVPFEETMRRHATRPQAAEFGRAEMQSWYCERDLLPGGIEQIIPAASSLDDTVRQVMRDAGLWPADHSNSPREGLAKRLAKVTGPRWRRA
jgi:hypothetical protein